MYVAAAKANVGDKATDEQKQWLRPVRDAVGQRYPGCVTATTSQRDSAALITQALDAGTNAKVLATDAGHGLRLYALARTRALGAAHAPASRAQLRPAAGGTRDGLRSVVDAITDRHPDFADLFEQVLTRETTDDKVDNADGR